MFWNGRRFGCRISKFSHPTEQKHRIPAHVPDINLCDVFLILCLVSLLLCTLLCTCLPFQPHIKAAIWNYRAPRTVFLSLQRLNRFLLISAMFTIVPEQACCWECCQIGSKIYLWLVFLRTIYNNVANWKLESSLASVSSNTRVIRHRQVSTWPCLLQFCLRYHFRAASCHLCGPSADLLVKDILIFLLKWRRRFQVEIFEF